MTRFSTVFSLLFSFIFASAAFAQSEPPNTEWEKKQNADERLRAFGDDLLGDGIDPHTGSISFTHTDVSIPGNFSLPVTIQRRRKQGLVYSRHTDVEFGDWELIVPRMYVVAPASNPWDGNRCSDPYSEQFPIVHQGYSSYNPFEYSEGVFVDTPGAGAQTVLSSPQGDQWPAEATHVTSGNWYLKCGSASDGGEGYVGKSPDGTTYRFDEVIVHGAPAQGVASGRRLIRKRYILAATEVTDVNGNWVKYDYDSIGRLTKIHSSDDREITLSYSSISSKLISSITANEEIADQRTWTYTYDQNSYRGDDWNTYPNQLYPNKLLDTVTLPDSRSWKFNLDNMTARPAPSDECQRYSLNFDLTHPSGVKGTFRVKDQDHRYVISANIAQWGNCMFFDAEPEKTGDTAPLHPPVEHKNTTAVMSVTSKVLTGPNMPTASWSYNYENDLSNSELAESDRHNWTVVNGPGVKMTYFHNWVTEPLGGKLMKKKTYEPGTTTLLESIDYDYVIEERLGGSFTNIYRHPGESVTPMRIVETYTERESGTDWTKTENSYDTDHNSSTYSFGRPITTTVSASGTDVTSRVTTTTYEHNTSKWVLGLTKKTVQNSRDIGDYAYDGNGRLTEDKLYGQIRYKVEYLDTEGEKGAIDYVENALGYKTHASDWKRGTPQLITREDTTTIAQEVDDNGWVMQTTNARGYITSYERDPMGRLTKLIPSKIDKAWDDTVVAYDFTGGGAVQTITKGNAKTTVTYDAMFRPILAKTQDTSSATPWVSYINMTYDPAGRKIFESEPSAVSSETDGTNFTYDGLGRLLIQDDNRTPNVVDLTNKYLADHATRVTDAKGEVTTTYKNGFGEVIKIEQPEDTTTTILRNQWGQMYRVDQSGNHNGFNVAKSQKYDYDDRQRLCRHQTASGGSTLFKYNDAGELYQSSRGHAFGTGCAAPSGDSLTEYKYDNMGRLELTKYFDELTPFTKRKYDANGNLKEVYRYPHTLDGDPEWENDWRSTSWRYDYNELDMLENETLKIVRRTFELDYDYNPDGSLKESSRSYRHDNWPSGDSYSYDFDYRRDGLGRATGVRMDGVSITSSAGFHPSGAMTGMLYGNGLQFTQKLNDRLQPERLRVFPKAGNHYVGTVLDLNYTYTDRGMVEAMNDNVDVTNNRFYEYDAQGRLETASGPWGGGTFTYDSVGNIRAKTLGTRNITLDYHEHRNRVSKSTDSGETGIRNIAYDARGNVEYLGEQRLIYDATDRPRVRRSTGAGNGYGKYRYDGHGRRISAWEREDGEWAYRYNAYDASGALVFVVEEENQFPYNDTITHYVKQDGKTVARVKSTSLNSTPEITWLHHDHLGSAVAGTKADGTTAWTEKYTPFGISMVNAADNDNQAGFTGHIKDSDTGLTYMQARYYDPVIGRFLSHDPVQFSAEQPLMFNRYGYTFNNPVNLVDRDGNYPIYPDSYRQFSLGIWEGATGSYTAWQLGRGIKNGDPRSIFVAHGMSVGLQLALNDKSLAAEAIGRSTIKNFPRIAGRVIGGSATSLVGGKGVGSILTKFRMGKAGTKAAQASVTLTNFTSGQIASAATALGGLYDSAVEHGFDPDSISVGALGNGAMISAFGGELNFDSESGQITAKMPAKTGSRIRRKVKLGQLEKAK